MSDVTDRKSYSIWQAYWHSGALNSFQPCYAAKGVCLCLWSFIKGSYHIPRSQDDFRLSIYYWLAAPWDYTYFFILQTRMCVMIDCRRQKRWRMASPGTSKTWLNSTGELIGLCFMTSSSLFVSRDDNGNLFESRGSTTVVMPNATTLDNLPSLQQQPCNPICNASDFFDCLSQGSWGKF